jgi:hypothetical protein
MGRRKRSCKRRHDHERARVALRACLITEQPDKSTFDDLFAEFWRQLTAGLDASGPAERPEDGPDGGLAPLGAEAAYEPTAREMAAALSYLDGLFAFGGPSDFSEIARQLRRQGLHGRIGYEHNARREKA